MFFVDFKKLQQSYSNGFGNIDKFLRYGRNGLSICVISKRSTGNFENKSFAFQRFAAEHSICLQLFAKQNGKKEFEGVLEDFSEKTVTLKTEKETLTFDRDKIANIKLIIKF